MRFISLRSSTFSLLVPIPSSFSASLYCRFSPDCTHFSTASTSTFSRLVSSPAMLSIMPSASSSSINRVLTPDASCRSASSLSRRAPSFHRGLRYAGASTESEHTRRALKTLVAEEGARCIDCSVRSTPGTLVYSVCPAARSTRAPRCCKLSVPSSI